MAIERQYAAGWLCAMAGIALVLGSCSTLRPTPREKLASDFADLRATAARVITDGARREAYLTRVGDMESELKGLDEYGADFVRRYRAAFTDYDVGDDQLRQLVEEFQTRQREAQARLIDLHLSMAAEVDASEFKRLARDERKIVETLRETPPGLRE